MSNQKQLREYQREAHKAAFKAWSEYRSCLIHAGTGAGKSIIAASIIKTVLGNGKRVLFLADSDDLCFAPLKTIGDYCDVYPALEKAAHKAPLEASVVVASMQTLGRRARREKFPSDHFDYILVDESHRGSKKKKEITDHFPEAFVCGFTATPWRQGLRDLSKYYETVAISLPMINLIERGFAPPIKVLSLPIEVDLNAIKQSMGAEGKDFDAEELDTCIAPYFQAIADAIAEHAWDRKIVAFLPLIKTSEAFAQVLRNNGIAAVHIDGGTKDRPLIYRALSRGDIQVICNAQVMSTGVDVPEADCYLNLRPTRSSAFYQQSLGRCCRPLPGVIDDLPENNQAAERKARIAKSSKVDCLVLDILWQHETLGVVRPGDMFTNTPEEAKKLQERIKDSRTPQELMALAVAVQREKELTLVERLKEAADKHRGKDLRAEYIGVYLDDKSLIEYEPVARWEMKPASPQQLELLQRMGIEMASVKSKGQASKIISALIERRKRNLATIKQVKLLQRNGVDNAARIPFEKASALIDRILQEIKAAQKPANEPLARP